jgi:(p)ppGpp synthase/HD superfamily hydrolase
MFEFAQTNLQLYRQMHLCGYCAEDRERVASAYRFLMPMFAGVYRGSEKPFISHLVGTASILVAHSVPVELVLAGLLHAVYMAGDFGFEPGTRKTKRKRQCVRDLVGVKVETIISAYDDIRWNAESVHCYLEHLEELQQKTRSALKLQLANTLEDLLDDGMKFCPWKKDATTEEMQVAIPALARALGCPELETQLQLALSALNSKEVSVDSSGFMGQSALVLPPSARRKFIPRARGWIVRRLRRLKQSG